MRRIVIGVIFSIIAVAGSACTQPEPPSTAVPEPRAITTEPPISGPAGTSESAVTSPAPRATPTPLLAATLTLTSIPAPTSTLITTTATTGPAPIPTGAPAPTPTAIPTPVPAPVPTLELTAKPTPTHSPEVDVPIIDAHSQFDQYVDPRRIIQLMDQSGVRRTILATRGTVTPEELISFASRYPGRIIPAVRSKGGPYERNEEKYYKKLQKQMRMEGFGAMAEVLMYHAQKGNKAPEIVVYPRDERVQAALRGALERDWPFVVHIEFAAAGERRDAFVAQLNEMLVQNPEQPFVMIHMG